MPRALILLLLLACDGSDKRESETGIEEPCPSDDLDCDGSTSDVDCDDSDPAVNPDAPDACGDEIDANCDGVVDPTCPCTDGDGDGYPGSGGETCDQDCDDGDAYVNPAATESCDGVDNDCDGEIDEIWSEATGADTGGMDTGSTDTGGAGAGVPDPDLGYGSYWPDRDDDGYGDPDELTYACAGNIPSDENGNLYVTDGSDCDDADSADHPGTDEVCDDGNDDEDCDGLSDDDDDSVVRKPEDVVYADGDADGYGNPLASTAACDPFPPYVANPDDCDDSDADINPGAEEVCDDADTDEDCDGLFDDDDSSVNEASKSDWYMDADDDTYTTDESTRGCDQPEGGYIAGTADTADDDCVDSVAAIHPDATELCNGVDDDCDGAIDEDDSADAVTWYRDADSDSYGDPSASISSCFGDAGYVLDGADCDDTDSAIHPGAEEVCDAVDQDCDGDIDEDSTDAPTWYIDSDRDGYGWADPRTAASACECPDGYVADDTDCDDSTGDRYAESVYYFDDDGDGFGTTGTYELRCAEGDKWVPYNTDCDDSAIKVNPAADEECDGIDNDCDGVTDGTSLCPVVIQTFETLTGLYATKTGGDDCEFAGHGPTLKLDVELRIESETSLVLTVDALWFESTDLGDLWDDTDGTTAAYNADYTVYTADSGCVIKQIADDEDHSSASKLAVSLSYVDFDTDIDSEEGDWFVASYRASGDSAGTDCASDDTRIEEIAFDPVTITLSCAE